MKKITKLLLLISINLISCTNNSNIEVEKDSIVNYLQNKNNIESKKEVQNSIQESIKPTSLPTIILDPIPQPTLTPIPEPSLFTLIEMLNTFSKGLSYTLSFTYASEKYVPFSNDNILKYLRDESFSKDKAEQVFYIRKNLKDIYDTVAKTNFINNEFVFFAPAVTPVFFAKYKDDLAFIISTVEFAFTLNSLNLDETNRAKKILKEYNLPLLNSFKNNFKESNIKYFGLSTAYGVRNFLSEKDSDTKVEVVSFVFTIDNLNKYLNGEISDNEFIKISDVFLKSKGSYQFKKIDIFNI